MDATYRIEVLETEPSDWADRLRKTLARELSDLGVHRSVIIELAHGHTRASPSTPVVAVARSGTDTAHDPGLREQIRAAMQDGVTVIPVVDDLAAFSEQVPPELAAYNGLARSGSSEKSIVRFLLEELGIEESERRVLVSHRRSDGLGAAEQLHDQLTHHRFKPFVDRFGILPGRDVQSEIADALEDFAFLLLLETPDAHRSDWVYDEVDYALAHTMGVLIIQWPGKPEPVPGSQGVPRLELASDDLTRDDHEYDVLTHAALERVLEQVEAAHAQGLVRRRRMLLRNAQEAAEAHGAHCQPLPGWCLDVTGASGRSVIAVSPRLPTPVDLNNLDDMRTKVSADAEGVLLHAARRLEPSRRSHLDWVIAGRNLKCVPENAIGAHW